MAFYPTLEGPALQAHRDVVAEMKRRAMRELNTTEDGIVVRDLIPADLGGSSSTSDYRANVKALGWSNILATINDAGAAQTVANNRWVAIEGVQVSGTVAINNGGAYVEQMRVTRKGATARYWETAPIVNWQNQTGWADDPVIIDANTTVLVEALARNAATLSNVYLLGTVVEKRGLLINP